jgi:transposase
MEQKLSRKDKVKLTLVKKAIVGTLTNAEAAVKLKVGVREIQKLKKKVLESGDAAIIHGNRGRSPKNATEDALKIKIIRLKKSKAYQDANFTYFRELLAEREDITIGYRTLHDLLNDAGIQSNKKHRPGGKRYRRRNARLRFGDLLQTDGTPFDWFGTGVKEALLAFLDDATGEIVGLYFCRNECLMGYYEAFRQVLVNHGIPNEIYADHSSNFFVNKATENWTIDEQLAGKCLEKTQFGRVAEILGVNLIPAGSPQAKGKIEKLWDTLQGRLPIWLDLNGITTIEAANKAVPQIIAWFNKRFGHEAADKEMSAFSPLPKDYDLDTLLAVKYERKTDACGCFSFQNITFQIESPKPIARKEVIFLFSEKIGFKVLYEKRCYPVTLLDSDEREGHSHLPEVTRKLLELTLLQNTKNTTKYKKTTN